MSFKLVSSVQNSIPASQMKDGQVGVITQWGTTPHYIGRIVQRYVNGLITIGRQSGESFSSNVLLHVNQDHRVRLLEPGEKLEIVDN